MIQDTLTCPFCGGQLSAQGQNPAWKEKWTYGADQRALVRWFACTKCGRDFEVCDPIEKDREETFNEYWQEHQDELLAKK